MSGTRQEMTTVSFVVPKPPEGFVLKRGVCHVVVENDEEDTMRTMSGDLGDVGGGSTLEEHVGLCYAAYLRAMTLLEEAVQRGGAARFDQEGNEEVRVEPAAAENENETS